jgi:tetratricopeptide (TPR) repeat protein/CHAT domain-containing protein
MRIAERYIVVARKSYGDDHAEVATALSWLAEAHGAQGRYGEAESLYKSALVIYEKALGPEHLDLGQLLNKLANFYRAQGRNGEAEPLYKRALTIREKALGPQHVTHDLNNLADFYRAEGRYSEAESYYRRALSIRGAWGSSPWVSIELNNLAKFYRAQGRYSDAEPLYKRALAIREDYFGWDADLGFANILSNLAELYNIQGHYHEAEPLYKRALAIREDLLELDHPDVEHMLDALAALYRAQSRNGEADSLYIPALAMRNNSAALYERGERYGQAESLFKRALAIDEVSGGDVDIAADLNDLAGLYCAQGRYSDAEPLYKRALAINERVRGPWHNEVATALSNLAGIYGTEGRYVEGELLYRRALAVDESTLSPEHVDIARLLGKLAALFRADGRYGAAEPLYKRALAIAEKTMGTEHPEVEKLRSNLVDLHWVQRGEADGSAFRSSITDNYGDIWGKSIHPFGDGIIRVAPLGNVHADFEKLKTDFGGGFARGPGPKYFGIGEVFNLDAFYKSQGREGAAERMYERALAIRTKVLGPEHLDLAIDLDNLADFYHARDRDADAEPLYKRTLAIRENALGLGHIDVGQSLTKLAQLYRAQSRYAEAESFYNRALTIREKALGPEHPDVRQSQNDLAKLYFEQHDWVRAADFWRRSTGTIVRHANDELGRPLYRKSKSERDLLSREFWRLIKVVHQLARRNQSVEADDVAGEMFRTAQWAVDSEAAGALTQMAARQVQAKGNIALEVLIRERQDLIEKRKNKDKQLITARLGLKGSDDVKTVTALAAEIAAIDERISKSDEALKRDHPDYTVFVRRDSLSVADVQALLGANEALLLILDTPELKPLPEESFIWVITKSDMRWVTSELGTKALNARVAALRCGLDEALWAETETATSCESALGALPRSVVDSMDEVLPFDLARAHELYKALLGPVEDMIKGKTLLIVPSGPLVSLPLNVLVTDPPKIAIPGRVAGYRDAAWLGTHRSMFVLPSVASLKVLRQFVRPSRAPKPYLGIGNPWLNGDQEDRFLTYDNPDLRTYYNNVKKQAERARAILRCARTRTPQRIASTRRPQSVRSVASLYRSGQVDIDQIRACAPLPETADEICEIGRRLGASESDILLGGEATKWRLKSLSLAGLLADYSVVHFATHGALSGDVEGATKPGLILTPPPPGHVSTLDDDDGFLTASDIAALVLDADWVVLSACNTAGPESESNEALSGMARAFFYAGARAVLVSHWAVGSDASVKLTTRAFDLLKKHPEIGRAEAFRLSMKELVEKGSSFDAHPSQWAPFVIVGEGGAPK